MPAAVAHSEQSAVGLAYAVFGDEPPLALGGRPFATAPPQLPQLELDLMLDGPPNSSLDAQELDAPSSPPTPLATPLGAVAASGSTSTLPATAASTSALAPRANGTPRAETTPRPART